MNPSCVHKWEFYDGCLGYESRVCQRCGVDWNDWIKEPQTCRLLELAPELVEALRALDKAFWPAANGWGDDIQDAIQEAHNLLSKLDLAPTEAHGKP